MCKLIFSTHASSYESDESSKSSEITDDDIMFSPSDSHVSDADVEAPTKTSMTSQPRVFLTFIDNIFELLKFCPSCGSPVDEEYRHVIFEGGMLCVTLTCLRDCTYN